MSPASYENIENINALSDFSKDYNLQSNFDRSEESNVENYDNFKQVLSESLQ
ncbi:7967_t:CDS:1, partial [Dentiscutata erythropus]